VDRDALAEAGLDVPVHAVVRDVELAAVEPPGEGGLPVQDGVPRLVPAQRPRLLLPEGEPVGGGGVVEVGLGVRLGGELLGRRETALLVEEIRQSFVAHEQLPDADGRKPVIPPAG
jgi:hypothetical protein